MQNIRELKVKIKALDSCKRLCDSMSTIANLRMMTMSEKSRSYLQRLKYFGNIIYNLGLSKDSSYKIQNFLFFSDLGFCGDFNNHKITDGDIVLGFKGGTNNSINNFNTFENNINNKMNKSFYFNVSLKDIHSHNTIILSPWDFIKDYNLTHQDCFIEHNIQFVLDLYKNLFLRYVFSLATYHENYFRSKIMKNAVENSKKSMESAKIDMNKLRQANITNEILLIVSGKGDI